MKHESNGEPQTIEFRRVESLRLIFLKYSDPTGRISGRRQLWIL